MGKSDKKMLDLPTDFLFWFSGRIRHFFVQCAHSTKKCRICTLILFFDLVGRFDIFLFSVHIRQKNVRFAHSPIVEFAHNQWGSETFLVGKSDIFMSNLNTGFRSYFCYNALSFSKLFIYLRNMFYIQRSQMIFSSKKRFEIEV